MSLSDPISNMLTNIRNAQMVRKPTVDIPASKLIGRILDIFKDKGYIEDSRLMKESVQGSYKVYLKYEKKRSKIIGLKRVSRPGLRVYATSYEIPRVLNGMGTAVISTSKGVLDDRDARKQKVGGEVLCYIW
jgi:small subunit ribosomal protein S8